jgi:hypothetical protein
MHKIAIVSLLGLWLVCLLTRHTMGGFVHVFLVLAIVLYLFKIVQGPP